MRACLCSHKEYPFFAAFAQLRLFFFSFLFYFVLFEFVCGATFLHTCCE